MKIFMNIILAIPAILPKGRTQMDNYTDYGHAVFAFFAFLVILFLIISPAKTKKSRIRSK